MIQMRTVREAGSVLLVSILMVVIALALAGSMISVSVSDAGSMRASEERTRAFHLAEAGLQRARYELSEDQDGNHSATAVAGTYTVASVDLGNRLYQATSTGRSGPTQVVLEETIEKEYVSKFPGGAVSIVGGMAMSSNLFTSSSDVFFDGGDSPGVVLNDTSLYNSVSSQFVSAVGSGFLQEADVVGSVTNTFQPGNVDLSMKQLTAAETSITLYSSMYTDFEATVTTVYLPAATSQTLPASGNINYGSSSSPVKYKLPADQKLKAGQTLTGYGTLVISKNFVVEQGATINWNGNIIIHGVPSASTDLFIHGNVTVNGNMVLLGGNLANTKFLIGATGAATVNGALTCLTQFQNTGTKNEFMVENRLNVNGLLSSVASKHQVLLKPGCDVNVVGSLQVGRPVEADANTEFVMTWDGALEVHKDNQMIVQGANALAELGGPVGTHVVRDVLTTPTLKARSWRVLSN